MNIERILSNPITAVIGQTNSGKSMLLANLITQYKSQYTAPIFVFGMPPEIHAHIPNLVSFSSTRELERIQNAIIVVDEVGTLFDLDNRKQKRAIEMTLRLIHHQNNRMVLSGLPTDFRKFIAAKATAFLYKSLTISDLINGSLAKTTLLEYHGPQLGSYVLNMPPNEVLCYDDQGIEKRKSNFWVETVTYYPALDTKKNQVSLFKKRS